jgi:hypothetical protein
MIKEAIRRTGTIQIPGSTTVALQGKVVAVWLKIIGRIRAWTQLKSAASARPPATFAAR